MNDKLKKAISKMNAYQEQAEKTLKYQDELKVMLELVSHHFSLYLTIHNGIPKEVKLPDSMRGKIKSVLQDSIEEQEQIIIKILESAKSIKINEEE